MFGVGVVGRPGGSEGVRRRYPNQIAGPSDFTAWTPVAGGAGVTPVVEADAVAAPGGAMTADRVTLDLGGSDTSGDISLLTLSTGGLSVGAPYYAEIWMRSPSGPVSILMRHVAQGGYTVMAVTASWQAFGVTEICFDAAGFLDVGLRGSFGSSGAAVLEMWGAELRRL